MRDWKEQSREGRKANTRFFYGAGHCPKQLGAVSLGPSKELSGTYLRIVQPQEEREKHFLFTSFYLPLVKVATWSIHSLLLLASARMI